MSGGTTAWQPGDAIMSRIVVILDRRWTCKSQKLKFLTPKRFRTLFQWIFERPKDRKQTNPLPLQLRGNGTMKLYHHP